MSTQSTKPTILLIGGGWHPPLLYAKLTTALNAAGYEVNNPALPSVSAARPPTASLPEDVAHVRSAAQSLVDAGKTVMALVHSYGGMVASDALSGLGLQNRRTESLPGGVSHIIYMTAFAVLPGTSISWLVELFGDQEETARSFRIEADGSSTINDPATIMVSGGEGEGGEETPTAEELARYLDGLVPWNAAAMGQGAGEAVWREVEPVFVYCWRDKTLKPRYQRYMVEEVVEKELGRKICTFELATGHCPNLTRTREVVGIVDQVAALG